jgi:hypothetical protein
MDQSPFSDALHGSIRWASSGREVLAGHIAIIASSDAYANVMLYVYLDCACKSKY